MKYLCSMSVLTASVLCLAVAACSAGDSGDDQGVSQPDAVDGDVVADSGNSDAVGDVPAGDADCVPTLEFVGEPEGEEYGADILMSSTQTRTINLQYSGCDNKTDVAINLEVLNGEHVCELEFQTVYTDSDGAALFQVSSKGVSGSCQIRACVSGRGDACVTVTVMVPDGKNPPLGVMFEDRKSVV